MTLHYLPLDRIIVDTRFEVTEAYLKRMDIEKNELFDVVLAVEKHPVLVDYYLLVGGFDHYAYLKKYNQQFVPCFLEETRTPIERDLKILRRFCNKGDNGKFNKKTIVKRLIQSYAPLEAIAKRISLSVRELITNYEFALNIPQSLITKYSTPKTLNWIAGLPFDQKLKNFMYYLAGLPQKHPERLTQENMKILTNVFAQAPVFKSLKFTHQKEIIFKAIKLKKTNINLLINMINTFSRV